MNYADLRTEIDADPATLGYSGKTDADVADLMNAAVRQSSKKIPSGEAYLYLVKRLKWRGIEEASKDANNPAFNAAYTSVKVVTGPSINIDLKDPVSETLLSGLVDAGLISTDDKAGLQALSEAKISRGEELGFGRVEYWDVARARAL